MKKIQVLLSIIAVILLMQSVVPTDSQLDLVTANRILANEAIAVISPDGVIGGFLALQTSGDAVLQVGSNEAANISMRVSADGTPTLFATRCIMLSPSPRFQRAGGTSLQDRLEAVDDGEYIAVRPSPIVVMRSHKLDVLVYVQAGQDHT